ncbi:hypothetical protein [Lysobacter capsici]|uniref:hypothetical protein n=1 Tax=Lysobacter capsici TaxID=435897 RepID=UPI000BBAE271|nr:hypothetical protein [Lysobacter capsici]ATE71883.1 hypothetical protein CNO08_11325 [Lysobacter capsici]
MRNIVDRFDLDNSSITIARGSTQRSTSRRTIRNATVHDDCIDRLLLWRRATCNSVDAHSEFGITDLWQRHVRGAVLGVVFEQPCG